MGISQRSTLSVDEMMVDGGSYIDGARQDGLEHAALHVALRSQHLRDCCDWQMGHEALGRLARLQFCMSQ